MSEHVWIKDVGPHELDPDKLQLAYQIRAEFTRLQKRYGDESYIGKELEESSVVYQKQGTLSEVRHTVWVDTRLAATRAGEVSGDIMTELITTGEFDTACVRRISSLSYIVDEGDTIAATTLLVGHSTLLVTADAQEELASDIIELNCGSRAKVVAGDGTTYAIEAQYIRTLQGAVAQLLK